MVKKPKFNLDIDGYPVKTLEDLQEHFHIEDVLMIFEDGRLLRWLESRGFAEEFDAVSAINKQAAKKDILSRLLEIFNIQGIDPDTIDKILYPQRTKAAYKNRPDIIQQFLLESFKTGALQKFLNKAGYWADYGMDIDEIDSAADEPEIITKLIDILFGTRAANEAIPGGSGQSKPTAEPSSQINGNMRNNYARHVKVSIVKK